MNSIEILNALIKRVNGNPLNSKKIYFTFTKIVELDKSKTLEIKFGISENNSSIFKEYLKEDDDIEKYKERLFSKVIANIFEYIYNRMDSGTFQDNGWSKIVRIDN